MNQWKTVCQKSDLVPNAGVCVKLGGEQVALFWEARNDSLFAVSNFDPFSEANVLSRGIIGSIGDELVVASPLYKQHFSLATGQCLEESEHCLKTYLVREVGGQVQLQTA